MITLVLAYLEWTPLFLARSLEVDRSGVWVLLFVMTFCPRQIVLSVLNVTRLLQLEKLFLLMYTFLKSSESVNIVSSILSEIYDIVCDNLLIDLSLPAICYY